MPKIVDHEERRQSSIDALWRVVSRHGAAAISVRSVAAEAGVTPSNLVHYFPSRADMLSAATERLTRDAIARLAEADLDNLTIESAVDIVMVTIPDTPTRRRQSEVWLLLMVERQSNDEAERLLRALQRTVYDSMVIGVTGLRSSGLLHPDRDIDLEAHRLHSLIDGLSLHTLTDPRSMPAARIREIITRHIIDLASSPIL